ncbi:MAG: ABC transporter substrate-binding protein [candidate division KSB1 bacterium]|nr:ABC transporter substrate-binding protein [candidate division KSB1 bacterium]
MACHRSAHVGAAGRFLFLFNKNVADKRNHGYLSFMKKIVITGLTSAIFLFACSTLEDVERPGPKRLIYGIPEDPESLDPAATTDLIYPQIVFNIFETLIRVDSSGKGFLPLLARDWETSQDGLRWKFLLRPGVVFHDRSPLDAKAVKASFERQFKQDNDFFHPDTTNEHGGTVWKMIREIRVIDNLTVEFVLEHPYSAFLYNIASPIAAAIVSVTALENYGRAFGSHPVGTGPWKFKRWEHDRHIVLHRFKRYWGDLPEVEEITYRVVPLLENRIAALRAGRLDVISGLSAAEANRLQHDRSVYVCTQKILATLFVGLNCQRQPLTNLEWRRAVAASLDIPRLVAALSKGFAEPAGNPLPPGILYRDSTLHQTKYEPQFAARFFANTATAADSEIVLSYYIQTDSLRDHPIYPTLRIAFEKAGLVIKLDRHQDWKRYAEQVLNQGTSHLFFDGWQSCTYHPDSFLYPLFHSASPHNFFKYKNAEVDQLLELGRQTLDETKQRGIYQKLQTIILRDVPAVFFSYPKAVYAVRKRVKHFTADAFAIPQFRAVKLE